MPESGNSSYRFSPRSRSERYRKRSRMVTNAENHHFVPQINGLEKEKNLILYSYQFRLPRQQDKSYKPVNTGINSLITLLQRDVITVCDDV